MRVRYPREIVDAVAERAKRAGLGGSRGVISGVRTRRGVEVVGLHELHCGPERARVSRDGGDGRQDGAEDSERDLLLGLDQQRKLMDCLEAAGTPVVSIYKSCVGTISEDEEWMASCSGKPVHPGVEYLVVSLQDEDTTAARAFMWDGRAFVGRDVGLEGD